MKFGLLLSYCMSWVVIAIGPLSPFIDVQDRRPSIKSLMPIGSDHNFKSKECSFINHLSHGSLKIQTNLMPLSLDHLLYDFNFVLLLLLIRNWHYFDMKGIE